MKELLKRIEKTKDGMYCEHCGHITKQPIWICPLCNYDLVEFKETNRK